MIGRIPSRAYKELLMRFRFVRQLLWRPGKLIVIGGLIGLGSLYDLLAGQIAPEGWELPRITAVLPNWSWQIWTLITVVVVFLVAIEAAFRMVAKIHPQYQAAVVHEPRYGIFDYRVLVKQAPTKMLPILNRINEIQGHLIKYIPKMAVNSEQARKDPKKTLKQSNRFAKAMGDAAAKLQERIEKLHQQRRILSDGYAEMHQQGDSLPSSFLNQLGEKANLVSIVMEQTIHITQELETANLSANLTEASRRYKGSLDALTIEFAALAELQDLVVERSADTKDSQTQ